MALEVHCFFFCHFNPLTPVTRTELLLTISIQYQSDRWWEQRKILISLRVFQLIQHQILRTSITRIEWQTVRRITIEILSVRGLKRESGWLALTLHLVMYTNSKVWSLPMISPLHITSTWKKHTPIKHAFFFFYESSKISFTSFWCFQNWL